MVRTFPAVVIENLSPLVDGGRYPVKRVVGEDLIVEADNDAALSSGMQGLCIRIARALNAMMERAGGVFADHYWSRLLRTPTELVNEASPLAPVSLYAQSKIDAEQALLEKKEQGFHPVILRLATAFGLSYRMRG